MTVTEIHEKTQDVENDPGAANTTETDATSAVIAETGRSPATPKVVRNVVMKAAAEEGKLRNKLAVNPY